MVDCRTAEFGYLFLDLFWTFLTYMGVGKDRREVSTISKWCKETFLSFSIFLLIIQSQKRMYVRRTRKWSVYRLESNVMKLFKETKVYMYSLTVSEHKFCDQRDLGFSWVYYQLLDHLAHKIQKINEWVDGLN